MKSKPEDEKNIVEIIDSMALRDHILGSKEEGVEGIRPEDDYARWNKLIDFYKQLSMNSPYREEIESQIISLILDESPLAVGAGLTLARLMDLSSSEEAVGKMIHDGVYKELPEHTQDLILKNLAGLQFDSMCRFLIEEILSRRILLPFLITWSYRPAYVGQVDADDLWRMDCLARFYEDEAKAGARGDVEAQLASEHLHRAKLVRICSAFLEEFGARYPQFNVALKRRVTDA